MEGEYFFLEGCESAVFARAQLTRVEKKDAKRTEGRQKGRG